MYDLLRLCKEYGLTLCVHQQGDRWATTVTWEKPPWLQSMATGHRALIVNETSHDQEESICKAATALSLWLEEHKDIKEKKQ